jgi:hypothetical protein
MMNANGKEKTLERAGAAARLRCRGRMLVLGSTQGVSTVLIL